jgi:hypothetical protein
VGTDISSSRRGSPPGLIKSGEMFHLIKQQSIIAEDCSVKCLPV